MCRITALSLLVLTALNLRLAHAEDDFPTVTLSQGTVKGKKISPDSSAAYYRFLGIPYAKPPLGSLRFKAPSDPEPWNGTLEALQDGNICKQFDLLDQKIKGEEDCLFINVYTPQLPGSGPLKPVMVWIHGGGFMLGSGNMHLLSPDLLIDAGIVYVSLNYRLGVFGFLSTEDNAVPGNAGMKDQVQALRWVQKNIASFGGDPSQVTIFGQSAGGASVQYHLLSPMSKGLFHAAIAQSGSVANPWAQAVKPRETAFLIGNTLGFSGNTTQELADFLRTIEAQMLLQTSLIAIPEREKHRLIKMVYVPTKELSVEGEVPFLPDDPLPLLEQGKFHDVPFITGVTSAEGLGLVKVAGLLDGTRKLEEVDKNFAKVLRRDLRACHVEGCRDIMISKLKTIYFEGQPLNNETLEKFIQLISDMAFTEGIVHSLNVMSTRGTAPMYLYQFTYDGGLGLMKKIIGATNYTGVAHGDELGYIFKFPSPGPVDPKDAQVQSQMITMWTNFAKTGKPTLEVSNDGIPTWLPYMKSEANYLDIGQELIMKKDLDKKQVDLWQDLYNSPQDV